jgi:hypothetical protein
MSKGIAIPVPQKYEDITLKNIHCLRATYGYQEQIELWEVGEEISEEARTYFSSMENIVFRNTLDYDDRIAHWRGYQVKGLVVKETSLDHFIFCDADSLFLQNPSIIQDSFEYQDTGSYMFRDFSCWQFKDLQKHGKDKWSDLDYFLGRKSFIQKLLPIKSPYFFSEWNYLYEDAIPTSPVLESSAETGVFYLNRMRHPDVAQRFYELNNNWQETYKYTHGDTATLWLSFVLQNKPFSINQESPLSFHGFPRQLYKGHDFYIQKMNV